MVATMAVTRQFARQSDFASTVAYSTQVSTSFLGTLFWLLVSFGLLLSAAFGLAGIVGCALKIITGVLR